MCAVSLEFVITSIAFAKDATTSYTRADNSTRINGNMSDVTLNWLFVSSVITVESIVFD